MVDKEIMKTRRHINVPKPAIKAMLGVLNKALWWPVGSADQVEREFHDQFIDKNAKTFADLDLVPGDIANFTYAYLVSFLVLLPGRYGLSIQYHNPLTHSTAPLPQRIILRPPSHVGEGEARGEEVPARPGRPIDIAIFKKSGNVERTGVYRVSFVCDICCSSVRKTFTIELECSRESCSPDVRVCGCTYIPLQTSIKRKRRKNTCDVS